MRLRVEKHSKTRKKVNTMNNKTLQIIAEVQEALETRYDAADFEREHFAEFAKQELDYAMCQELFDEEDNCEITDAEWWEALETMVNWALDHHDEELEAA